ncbi:SBBP repeat-containing protein [Polyangium sp. y55x31]|uniref:SBBP repeat-containing protein n=1 Tax=Polyangium sp. y55x31 TaxID=3042688 RepID=UPI0024823D98|nr:SBBP repeat-containing protein [Polyangium sp. y55x31]MDI1481172.1 SBBP repeat-containing protein [Polyangium sp. y55x31]
MNPAHILGKAMMTTGRWTAAGLCLACLAPAMLGCGPVDEMVVEEWEEVEVRGGSDVVSEEENVAEATEALTSVGFSTFVGGPGSISDVIPAVDPAGNVYVAASALTINTSNIDIFVAKYSPSGALLWTATFGGSNTEDVRDIAVDNAGCVYVLAKTYSYGPSQTNLVAKLNAAGNALAYYSRFGGSGEDRPYGIAVDPAGNAYVAGSTLSADFPVTPGAMQQTLRGDMDAFVTKLNAAGSSLVYSTYLGGSGSEDGMDIAVDAAGYAYVVGSTSPPPNGVGVAFPTTFGAYQRTYGNPAYGSDVFVTELIPSGSAPYYSTLIGGSTTDAGYRIGVDSAYNAYVVGISESIDFPTTPGAFRRVKKGLADEFDVFVTKVNEPGSAIWYSTWVGSGPGREIPFIAVSSSGKAYVSGTTTSNSLPVTANALQKTYRGASDGFLMELNVSGSAAAYSTYLGGSGYDSLYGVAVDPYGNAVVAGWTDSANFPVYNAAQPTPPGAPWGGFVTKFLGP